MKCSNNLKQLGLGVHNYHDTNGSLLPMLSPSGCCWGTWTILIMPYVEQDNVFKLYQNFGGTDTVNSGFPAPSPAGSFPRYGSSPNTTNVTARRFPFLTCPSDQENAPFGTGSPTNFNYVVNGGNGGTYGSAGPAPTPAGYTVMAGMFNGSNFTKKIKLTDVTDGLTNSLMFAEVLQGQGNDLRGFGWWGNASAFSTYYPPNTKANDLVDNCVNSPLKNLPCATGGAIFSSRSRHTGGVNVCLGDGSCSFIRESIDPTTWTNLGPINDGAVVSIQ